MGKKELGGTPTDTNSTEPVPVHNDQLGGAIVTAANLHELLKNPEFAEIRDHAHEKINHENTVIAIVNAAELGFDAPSKAISDDSLGDVPPSAT